MVTIFISHRPKDAALANKLREALGERDYKVWPGPNSLAAGEEWRKSRMNLLRKADAVVSLVTKGALCSQLVAAEVGAARLIQETGGGIALLPVLVGNSAAPKLFKGVSPIKLKGSRKAEVEGAADRIQKSLKKHFEQMGGRCPPVFISHRHKHPELAEALARLIRIGLPARKGDIRCTSVKGHKFKAGVNVNSRIRTEIGRARAVLGIITPDIRESTYVLFELGASWGRGDNPIILLAKGATYGDIPVPVSDLQALNLADEDDCRQLVKDLRKITGRRRRREMNDAHIAEAVRAVVRLAAPGAGARG